MTRVLIFAAKCRTPPTCIVRQVLDVPTPHQGLPVILLFLGSVEAARRWFYRSAGGFTGDSAVLLHLNFCGTKAMDSVQRTALHYAVGSGCTELCQLLVYNMDIVGISLEDRKRKTAAQLAVDKMFRTITNLNRCSASSHCSSKYKHDLSAKILKMQPSCLVSHICEILTLLASPGVVATINCH